MEPEAGAKEALRGGARHLTTGCCLRSLRSLRSIRRRRGAAGEGLVVSIVAEPGGVVEAGSAAFVRYTPYSEAGRKGKMSKRWKAAVVVAVGWGWAVGVSAQEEERAAFKRAANGIVAALGSQVVPGAHVIPLVDPRPVSASLHNFSEGLPAQFVEASEDFVGRRRAWVEETGIQLGDAVMASRCWATPMLITVPGQEPDSSAVAAIEEWEIKCEDRTPWGMHLVFSLPRMEHDNATVIYRVVGYGHGCMWAWDVVVPKDGSGVNVDRRSETFCF